MERKYITEGMKVVCKEVKSNSYSATKGKVVGVSDERDFVEVKVPKEADVRLYLPRELSPL